MKTKDVFMSPATVVRDALGTHGKIVFADQLRAVAALCVLIVHLLGMYWLGRDVVAAHIFAPALQGPSAKSLAAISFAYFNFGPFGVALFFLVSGFVIPFSVTKATRLRFLAARALRIYPTYAACAALGLLAVWLSSWFWHLPFGWNAKQVLQNVLLVHNLAGTDSIDMVNWSLAIEIKFYLIACLLAAPIARGRILPLLVASLAVALTIAGIAYGVPGGSVSLFSISVRVDQLAHDLLFIPFMLVGTMFSYRFRGLISRAQLLMSVAALCAIFLASWLLTILKSFFSAVPINYFYALAVFALAYAWRDRFRPVWWVDWLASISYPLYALHTLIGYAAMRFLGALGVTYYLAFVLATAIAAGLAYLVHRTVELPTQELGKRVMRRAASVDFVPVLTK
jgi:peptidoglycan/LPS O-acetylase OafA/YrhL